MPGKQNQPNDRKRKGNRYSASAMTGPLSRQHIPQTERLWTGPHWLDSHSPDLILLWLLPVLLSRAPTQRLLSYTFFLILLSCACFLSPPFACLFSPPLLLFFFSSLSCRLLNPVLVVSPRALVSGAVVPLCTLGS